MHVWSVAVHAQAGARNLSNGPVRPVHNLCCLPLHACGPYQHQPLLTNSHPSLYDTPACLCLQPPNNGKQGVKQGLGAVAETDFEEQMSELSEENLRLGQRLAHMEVALEQRDSEVRRLHAKLNALGNHHHSGEHATQEH